MSSGSTFDDALDDDRGYTDLDRALEDYSVCYDMAHKYVTHPDVPVEERAGQAVKLNTGHSVRTAFLKSLTPEELTILTDHSDPKVAAMVSEHLIRVATK